MQIAQVVYNGIPLDINRVRLVREPIYSPGNVNYLYTQVTLTTQGVFNPACTSFAVGPRLVAYPPGNLPAITDVSVRDALSRPQQLLTYTVGNQSVITSPWPLPNQNITVDDNNGPFPLHVDVEEVQGQKLFKVNFVVRTYINENRIKNPLGGFQAVLSHTWSQEDDIDEHFFLTRTTTGKVVFSTAMLQAIQQGKFLVPGLNVFVNGPITTPDSWRPKAFQNPLPFTQRRHIHVEVDEQMNSLTYTYTDRERCYNLIPRNITEITCRQGIGNTRPDESLRDYATAKALAQGAALGYIAGGSIANSTIGGVASGLLYSTLVGTAFAAAERLNPKWQPKTTNSWSIDVYGNRNCTKTELMAAASTILTVQANKAGVGGFAQGATTCTASFDLLGKHLHVDASTEQSAGARVVFGVRNLLNFGGLPLAATLPDPALWGDEQVAGVFNTNANQVNPTPPGDQISRGYVRNLAFGQGLAGAAGR